MPAVKNPKAVLLFVVKLSVSVSLLVFVAYKFDIVKVAAILRNADPYLFGGAVVINLLQILLAAKRWQLFGRALGLKARAREYVATAFASAWLAQIAPTSLVGDVWKVAKFKKDNPWRQIVMSLVLDKLSLHISWMFLFLLALPFLNLPAVKDFKPGLGLKAGAALALAVGLAVWLRRGAWKKVEGGLRFLFGNRSTRGHFTLSLVLTLSLPLVFLLCNYAVGAALDVKTVFLLFPLVFVSLALPFSFAGWGLRELAVVGTYSAFLGHEELLATSVLFGIAGMVGALPGSYFLLNNRR